MSYKSQKPNRVNQKDASKAESSGLLLRQYLFLVMLAGDTRLNGCDRAVATFICDCLSRTTKDAFPSYGYLVRATGCCRSAVAKSVKKLVALGIVAVVSGGKGRSNRYVPALPLAPRTSVLPLTSPREWTTPVHRSGP